MVKRIYDVNYLALRLKILEKMIVDYWLIYPRWLEVKKQII